MGDTADSSRSHGDILERARWRAAERGAPHAGDLTPSEAAALLKIQGITLVDIRSRAERVFVGRVPGSPLVEWSVEEVGTDGERFIEALRDLASNGRPLVLSCRSGKRSDLAARFAGKAGLATVYNMLEGFEGDPDEQGERSKVNGWRHAGLPWVRDEEPVR